MKTLTFVNAEANAAAKSSTIALRERCSGELKNGSKTGHYCIIVYLFNNDIYFVPRLSCL